MILTFFCLRSDPRVSFVNHTGSALEQREKAGVDRVPFRLR